MLRDNEELITALENMLGWLLYAEECDHWFFTDEQAPSYRKEREEAQAALDHARAEPK